MIAIRVPPDVAAERRRRVREAAKARKKHQLMAETLALCDRTILITNLPSAQFAPDDIVTLQRLRWQIELLFKLWKTGLSMDHWRTQQPHQILSEVYAKLILALIQHWFLLLGCWQQQNRSLVKATHALRKHAFHTLAALSSIRHLRRTLAMILPTLARCTTSKRKTRPATFQFLARAFP
jgi:IS4 transposase